MGDTQHTMEFDYWTYGESEEAGNTPVLRAGDIVTILDWDHASMKKAGGRVWVERPDGAIWLLSLARLRTIP